ncbi:choice-of-anchor I family protein [Bowdeniella massiliensis]|uniref:choice-of-anchor I family protein n=1 Tax=Bowdeniella massiliensis TaxID=2932264 RepID=UPI0020298B0A|nr:choice-of-anchor I family protein [Bowdeniella massiliensis]
MSPLLTAALSAAAITGLSLAPLAPASTIEYSADNPALELQVLGTYETGKFGVSAAEIVAFHAATARILVVNAADASVEVLNGSDPENLTKLFDLKTTDIAAADGSTIPAGAVANSVAVRADGLGVVAVEHSTKTESGWLVFFDAAGSGEALGAVRVGALPDMVAISADGSYAVVANEGEPAEDYSVDPEGTVSIVSLPTLLAVPGQDAVKTADFRAFEGDNLPAGVRIFDGREDAGTGTPEFPVAENLEPEYVTIEGTTAYVSLQEANALAVVDLPSATVTALQPLGAIDLKGFDISDKDGAINPVEVPIKSWRQPDAIASLTQGGATYILTANEGDARDWEGYSEEARVKNLGKKDVPPLCEGHPLTAVENYADDAVAGRLKITLADGLSADGSCYEELYGFGTRSMSVFGADGSLVADTGTDFERITTAAAPEFFNSNHEEAEFDSRSDDKGPEPEGIVVGEVGGTPYAFIGFERVGGIAVYDVSNVHEPAFVTYVNNRDFAADPAAAGDLGPEGLTFVSAEDSPTGEPWLIVGNEVSGTTTVFAARNLTAAPTPTEQPTQQPTAEPTEQPTEQPTQQPTAEPTALPTEQPTAQPPVDKPRLPVTGASAGLMALAGAALAAGAGLLAARRESRA